ncbi:sensor histidine kinase [Terricaulis sp.]|uniref:sensor histidine kinase n=1 Tax=Terricaulis sp. TaxID=2768686 RepID=UPI002AC47CD8|nr:sensor histidine kinase [Terricaulis sp.]MDZ4690136.1 sensor histidine kinase [Terricaulis sp.]
MQRSLRVRLLIGAACAIFAALAIAWVAMGYLFERHTLRRVQAELTTRGIEVISGLYAEPNGAFGVEPAPADPRFNTPASGLYWQVSGENVLVRSRSLWDERLPAPALPNAEGWSAGTMAGPFAQQIFYVARPVQLDAQGPRLVLVVAADRASVSAARAEFTRELALFLLLLWVTLSAAAWIQVQLGLRPLEDVRVALGALRQQASARLSERDYPAEAAPLANAINELAAARETDLDQAKRRAADLAHSLKTPLSALAAQTRRAREAGATDAAEGLERAIAAARAAVERELARTRAAASRGESGANGRIAVAKVVQVLERTERGGTLVFDNEVTDAPYPIGEDVLLELAGPLLENAARYAATRVRISGDGRALSIEDDGPGLSDEHATAAMERGKRLDESGDGHGLGLPIAHEIALAVGAELKLSRAELGGLRVDVLWPPG